MGLFDWIKRILDPNATTTPRCPRCGFLHAWDGRRCSHCGYPAAQPPPHRPQSRQISEIERHRQTFGQPGFGQAPTQSADATGYTQAPPTPSPASPQRRVEELTELDASQFAPMSSDEQKDAINAMGTSWRSAYYDSLSIIPDGDLQRIQIIDRGMAAAGLITSEELAEIHTVGKQYDAFRGHMQQAVAASDHAAQRSREERAERKKQKQEEAAQRRKERAEQIAHHRATDIVHLGRGVSKGLADRRANVEMLTALELPVLATPGDVAEALGLGIPKLRWLAWHAEASRTSHYIRFTIPKKSGGVRELAAPHRTLAACQYWILDQILRKIPVHEDAHGFVPGRNTLSNAQPHLGKHVLVNCDLKDFFPTITVHRVIGLFRSFGYSPAAATILALLCTDCPRRQVTYDGEKLHVATGPRGLPQGACTSPAISNLVARKLDGRLKGIADKLGWTYTRYADDLSFSGGREQNEKTGYLLARIRHIAQDEGFALNHEKTRVQRPNAQQSVTGVVVNKKPHVPRRTIRRLRAILHRAQHEGLEAQNRQGHENFDAWLAGMIAYVNMVNPQQAAPLREAYERVKR